MVLQKINAKPLDNTNNDTVADNPSIQQGNKITAMKETNVAEAEEHMKSLQQTSIPDVSFPEGSSHNNAKLSPAFHTSKDNKAAVANSIEAFDGGEGNNPGDPNSNHQNPCDGLTGSIAADVKKLRDLLNQYQEKSKTYKDQINKNDPNTSNANLYNTVLVNSGNGLDIHIYNNDVVSYMSRILQENTDTPDRICAKLVSDFNIKKENWGNASALQPVKDLFNNKCRDPAGNMIRSSTEKPWAKIPDPTGQETIMSEDKPNPSSCPKEHPIFAGSDGGTNFCCASKPDPNSSGYCLGTKGDGANRTSSSATQSYSIKIGDKEIPFQAWSGFGLRRINVSNKDNQTIRTGISIAEDGEYSISYAPVGDSEKDNYSQADAPPGFIYLKNQLEAFNWGSREIQNYPQEGKTRTGEWTITWLDPTPKHGFFYIPPAQKRKLLDELERYVSMIISSPSPKDYLTSEFQQTLVWNRNWMKNTGQADSSDGICAHQFGGYFNDPGKEWNWETPTEENSAQTNPDNTDNIQSMLANGGACQWNSINGCPSWHNYNANADVVGAAANKCSINAADAAKPPKEHSLLLLELIKNFYNSIRVEGDLSQETINQLNSAGAKTDNLQTCRDLIDTYGLWIYNGEVIAGCVNDDFKKILQQSNCAKSNSGWITPAINSDKYETGCNATFNKGGVYSRCPAEHPIAYDGNFGREGLPEYKIRNGWCCNPREPDGGPLQSEGNWAEQFANNYSPDVAASVKDTCYGKTGKNLKCPSGGSCIDHNDPTPLTIPENKFTEMTYFPERIYINKFGYTQDLAALTNGDLSGRLNAGIKRIKERCQPDDRGEGNYISKEDGCFTDIPTRENVVNNIKTLDSIFTNCKDGSTGASSGIPLIMEGDYSNIKSGMKQGGMPIPDADDGCEGPIMNKSYKKIAGTIVYYNGDSGGEKGYYWVDAMGYAAFISRDANMFNENSVASRCMPYLGITRQTLDENTSLSDWIDANKDSITVDTLPAITSNTTDIKTRMCSSYDRSAYVAVQEAGDELADQMRIVNDKIKAARSCSNIRGTELINTEKALALLVQEVNNNMTELENVKMRRETDIGKEETTNLIKNSYKTQFIVWTILAVILFAYGLFGITSGSGFKSPMHLAMMVACVLIIFIILRRFYLSGII